MLGLTKRVVLTASVVVLAACPGDPTEASTLSASGSDETSVTADDGPTSLTADDDSATISDTSAEGSDTDPSDTMPDPMCGNGVVESGEDCDIGPDNTMGATCTYDCRTNECGDGYVGYMESCDPPGDGCAGNCIVSSCGDGDLDEGEDCDWVLDPECPKNCMLGCGDGRIDRGEECEGKNLNGASCSTVGFVGGDLQCGADCQFVETGCHNCGDGITQAGEQCDMTVSGYDCVAAGHLDGVVTCTLDCLYDTSQCVDFLCGNNTVESPEICDGTDLAGHSCASEGFAPTGGIACNGDCTLNTGACLLCGNGVVDAGEECDSGMLPVSMCSALGDGWDQGDLTCASNCTYNENDCCYDDPIMDECTNDDDCCGTLECDNQMDYCCLPANAPCPGDNDPACCSGNCNGGSGLCNGGDS